MSDKIKKILIGAIGLVCFIGAEIFKDSQKKDEIRKIVNEQLNEREKNKEEEA